MSCWLGCELLDMERQQELAIKQQRILNFLQNNQCNVKLGAVETFGHHVRLGRGQIWSRYGSLLAYFLLCLAHTCVCLLPRGY
jgi:hypothetical protein